MKVFQTNKSNLILLVLASLVIIQSFGLSGVNAATISGKKIKKPLSDYRSYEVVYLSNNLKVLLIEDPLTVYSAFSVLVKSGSMKDKRKIPGLAHLCEHVSFLGSKKYPDPERLMKLIGQGNGETNAYTEKDHINLFAEVHTHLFPKIIKTISKILTEPLFSHDQLSHEISNVNSEFEKNEIIDKKKREELLNTIMEQKNPYSKFSTGNFKTLRDDAKKYGFDLSKELHKFHQKYFHSGNMNLIFMSNLPIEQQKKLAEKYFSTIPMPKKENTKKSTPQKEKVYKKTFNVQKFYGKSIYPSLILYKATSKKNCLNLYFASESFNKKAFFSTNPFGYFMEVATSDSAKSLKGILKAKSLAASVILDTNRNYKDWSDFVITINLTNKGKKNIKEVLAIFESYVVYFKENLINDKIYSNLKKLSDFKYHYNSLHNTPHYLVVKEFSRSLNFNKICFLQNKLHFMKFDFSIIKSFADQLQLSKSILLFPIKLKKQINFEYNKTNPVIPKRKDRIFKTEFSVHSVNYKSIKSQAPHTFEPIDLVDTSPIEDLLKNVKKCDSECIKKLKSVEHNKPKKIKGLKGHYSVWFSRNLYLDHLKVNFIIEFQSNDFEDKLHFGILKNMLEANSKHLQKRISSYLGTLAFSLTRRGIQIELVCFSNFIESNIEELMELFKNIAGLTKANFLKYKEMLSMALNGSLHVQPFQYAIHYVKNQLLHNYSTPQEDLEKLKKLKFKHFTIFAKSFYDKIKIKAFFNGDIKKEKAITITDSSILPLFKSKSQNSLNKTDPKNNIKNNFELSKQDANYLMKVKFHDRTNLNNLVMKCFNLGKFGIKTLFYSFLLKNIIENFADRFFRFRKSFGYVAEEDIQSLDNNKFLCVLIQGSYKLPQEIDAAFADYYQHIEKTIQNFSSENFEVRKMIAKDIILDTKRKLVETSDNYFVDISHENCKFIDFHELETFAKNLKISEIKKFFSENIQHSKFSFTLYIFSHNHSKDMDKIFHQSNYTTIANKMK